MHAQNTNLIFSCFSRFFCIFWEARFTLRLKSTNSIPKLVIAWLTLGTGGIAEGKPTMRFVITGSVAGVFVSVFSENRFRFTLLFDIGICIYIKCKYILYSWWFVNT
jgi:hypothetical protein